MLIYEIFFFLAQKSQMFCLTSLLLFFEFRFNVVNVDGKFSIQSKMLHFII